MVLSSAGLCPIQCDSSYVYVLTCIVTPGLKHIYLKPTSCSLPHHQNSQEALTMQRGAPHQHNGANIQPSTNCSCVSLRQMHPGSAQTWAFACNNPLVVRIEAINLCFGRHSSHPQQRALQPADKSVTSQRAPHWEGKGPCLWMINYITPSLPQKLSPVPSPNHVLSWPRENLRAPFGKSDEERMGAKNEKYIG